MRNILIAAAFAVGSLVASNAALAQQGPPPYQAGGPNQEAGWCKVNTDQMWEVQAYGYYKPCAGATMAYAPRSNRYR